MAGWWKPSIRLLVSDYTKTWRVEIIYWWFASAVVLQPVIISSDRGCSGDSAVILFDKGYIIFFCHSIFHCCFISCLQGPAADTMHTMISMALNLFSLQCISTKQCSIPGNFRAAVWPGWLRPWSTSVMEFRAAWAFSDSIIFGYILVETKWPLISSGKTKHITGKVGNTQPASASVSPETEIDVFLHNLIARERGQYFPLPACLPVSQEYSFHTSKFMGLSSALVTC